MHNVLVIQFIAASYEVAASAMRGMGKSIAPTLVTIFGTCVLRMVWVFAVLPHFNDFKLLMWVYPFSWAITGFMMLTLYRIHWKNVKSRISIEYSALNLQCYFLPLKTYVLNLPSQ